MWWAEGGCCSPSPPIVLTGEQETYSGLEWRWHLVSNLSCLNYPGADKGRSFNKSLEQQIPRWRTLMKCLGAYFQLEIRTYRERWVERLAQQDNTLMLRTKKSAAEVQHSTHNGKKIINKQINNDDDLNEEKPGWRLWSPEASLPVIWPPASSHCSPSAATASSRCANGTFWILPADCTVW